MRNDDQKNSGARKKDRWERILQWVTAAFIAALLLILVAPSILRKSDRISAWLDEKKAEEAMEFGRRVARMQAEEEAMMRAASEMRSKRISAWLDERKAEDEASHELSWEEAASNRDLEREVFRRVIREGNNNITGVVNWQPWIRQVDSGDGVDGPVTFRFQGEWMSCMAVYRAFTESMRHAKATASPDYSSRLSRHSAEIACGNERHSPVGQAVIVVVRGDVHPPGTVVVGPEYRVPKPRFLQWGRSSVHEIVDMDWGPKRSELLVYAPQQL